jgi:hypothetical protein
MHGAAELIDAGLVDGSEEARAFADSVAGVVTRLGYAPSDWRPGEAPGDRDERERAVCAALEALGWSSLADGRELAAFAGLGAVELGRRLAPIEPVDALLGASPLAGDLARTLGTPPIALVREQGRLVRRAVHSAQPCPSAEGLRVARVQRLGPPLGFAAEGEVALAAWLAASIGYLGGLGQGALELTVDYVGQRRAFGSTLAALAPVQQMLAGAATRVRGVRLLAAQAPGAGHTPGARRQAQADALAHAGEAIVSACAACQQATGAIGFTLDYPLHRYAQRARALATWNDALLDTLLDTRA